MAIDLVRIDRERKPIVWQTLKAMHSTSDMFCTLDVVLCRRLSRLSGTFATDHVVSIWPSTFHSVFAYQKL